MAPDHEVLEDAAADAIRRPCRPRPASRPPARAAFRLVWASAPGWTTASLALVAAQGLLPLATLYLISCWWTHSRRRSTASCLRRLALEPGLAAHRPARARSCGSSPPQAPSRSWRSSPDPGGVRRGGPDRDRYRPPQRRHPRKVRRARPQLLRGPALPRHAAPRAGGGRLAADLPGEQHAAGRRRRASRSSRSASLLLSLNWAVGLVLFLASVPAAVLRVHYAGQLYLWRRKTTADARLTWYLHALLTDSHYAKELRMLDLGGVLTRRFRDLRARMRGERLEIVLALDRRLVRAGRGDAGHLRHLRLPRGRHPARRHHRRRLRPHYQAFQRGQGWLRDALNNLANLYEGSLFLGDLFDFLDLKVSEGAFRLPPTPVDLPASALGPPPAAEGASSSTA